MLTFLLWTALTWALYVAVRNAQVLIERRYGRRALYAFSYAIIIADAILLLRGL